jgi:hypothetical protein
MMTANDFWGTLRLHLGLPFPLTSVDYIQDDGLVVMKDGKAFIIRIEELPTEEDFKL